MNLPSNQKRKGDFDQLDLLLGTGFHRTKSKEIVSMVDWSVEEEYEIANLKGVNTRDSIEDKKYRHICYLCKSVYAFAISNELNISTNPGFEWQLR